MSNPRRDTILAALDSYSKKQVKKDKATANKGKRNAPEKAVEKEVLKKANKLGLDLTVVDSARTFTDQGHTTTMTSEPVTDLMGDCQGGIAAYVELKSPQNRTNISYNQYRFLERKIKRGCFGACVHSAERLESIYLVWKDMDFSGRIKFLLGELPTNKKLRQRLKDDEGDLF